MTEWPRIGQSEEFYRKNAEEAAQPRKADLPRYASDYAKDVPVLLDELVRVLSENTQLREQIDATRNIEFGIRYEADGRTIDPEDSFYTDWDRAQEDAETFREDLRRNNPHRLSKGDTVTDPASVRVVARRVTPWDDADGLVA